MWQGVGGRQRPACCVGRAACCQRGVAVAGRPDHALPAPRPPDHCQEHRVQLLSRADRWCRPPSPPLLASALGSQLLRLPTPPTVPGSLAAPATRRHPPAVPSPGRRLDSRSSHDHQVCAAGEQAGPDAAGQVHRQQPDHRRAAGAGGGDCAQVPHARRQAGTPLLCSGGGAEWDPGWSVGWAEGHSAWPAAAAARR